MSTSIVLPPGKGQVIAIADARLFIKAHSGQTHHKWSVTEYQIPAGFQGPPPHYHGSFEEAFYVLGGELLFTLEGEQIRASEGTFLTIPPGRIHTFSNPGPSGAALLTFLSPGGFEGYFEELAGLMQSEPSWPPADPKKVIALMAKYDTYLP